MCVVVAIIVLSLSFEYHGCCFRVWRRLSWQRHPRASILRWPARKHGRISEREQRQRKDPTGDVVGPREDLLSFESFSSSTDPTEGNRRAGIGFGLTAPNDLAEMFPHLIYVIEDFLNFPSPEELFQGHFNWTDNYVVHLWRNRFEIPNGPSDIKKLDSAFGEIMRYIYFGSKNIIE